MCHIRKAKELVLIAILLLAVNAAVYAQPFTKVYAFKEGKMYIELSKNLPLSSLDSFIRSYNLGDIGLHQLVAKRIQDSLKLFGWKIQDNDRRNYTITKSLTGFDNFNNPSDKIVFTGKNDNTPGQFSPVNNGVIFGYNRFKNKYPFAVQDSAVTFFLRNNQKAANVMLAGSFNNWNPNALQMQKTDSGWIARVKLGAGKYWYKFIVDGNWRPDEDNQLRENDGRGNINSVYFKPNVNFSLHGFTNARRVYLAGSFNRWREKDLLMERTATGWKFPAYLADGTHTYKFIADGQWYADEKNPKRFPDEFGGYNSYIALGKPHLFSLNGYKDAKRVVVSGSFNNWRKDELYMNKTATGWELPYVLGNGNYEYKFLVDNSWITDPQNPLMTDNPNHTGNSFLIIGANYTFKLKGFTNAKSVFLAGDFNNWNPSSLPMHFNGNEWTFKVHLSVGKHRYKFLVDGKWIIDPANKLWEQNEFGTGNSVIWIEE